MNSVSNTTHSDYSLSGLDLFLALLGLIGISLFAVFLPTEHPDSAAVFEISESEAADYASDFLSDQGLNKEGLLVEANLVRRPELLSNLQQAVGRPTATEFLHSENRNQIAAYYWEVDYRIPRDPDTGGFFSGSKDLYKVELAQNGLVISFNDLSRQVGPDSRQFGSTRDHVQRAALASILKPDSSSGTEIRSILAGIPDSVFAKSLRATPKASRSIPTDSLLWNLQASREVVLDSSRLHNLLDFHLSRSAFGSFDWTVDSLEVNRASNPPIVRFGLTSAQPVAGQNVSLVATMTPAGTLTRLGLSYKEVVDSTSVSSTMDIIGIGLFVLLSLVFIVVFFRRMIARLLDIKSAMIDAMILGIITGALFATGAAQSGQMTSDGSFWATIVINMLVFSFSAGGVAVFAFMIAGVTDSVVREYDAGKLRTLVLLRHGELMNRPMGAGFLRGTSIAGIILGLCVILLALFPEVPLEMEKALRSSMSVRPFVAMLFSAFSSSYFYVLLWMVGVASLAFKWAKKPLFAIVLVVITGTFIDVGPFAVQSGYVGVGISAFFALILALSYVRFDILTVLIALFVSKLIWGLSEGFLISGSPTWVDLLLAGIFVSTIIVLGIIGVASKRTGQEADTYVPGYVTEMAGQERVKRELEIAQQVQTFFLPRRMPTIAGLEISGMCLPATEVGGDYYDFIELEGGRMAFILGDVSGKGIEAAFFMTLVKGIIQTLSRQGLSAAEVLRRLNHLFCMNAPKGTFISVIYGEFNPKDQSFTFARAGHNPAILFEASKSEAKALQPRGMAIGFADGERFDTTIEEVTVTLQEGDSMVFYTDGFSEAMNRKRDLYGDDRLLSKVSHFGDRSASAILRLMTEDVHHFIEGMGRADDMTMVVMKSKAASDVNHA